ncbi:hypothetical protein [Bacillus sp. OAE603]|uniref:hypothetical protein n=1 Tax=Gottfriedia sp. OAE603 TaxID=2663872 RepID=UPI00178AC427
MKKHTLYHYFIRLVVLLLIISSLPINSFANELSPGEKNPRMISSKDANAKEISTVEDKVSTDNLKTGEIVEERTANTKVFYNGNDTYTKQIYFEPIHIKEKGDTNYEEISSDLVLDKQNTDLIETENTKLKSTFLSKMENGKYATFENNNHTLAFSILEASGDDVESIPVKDAEATFETENNKVVHKDIFPQVDLRNLTFNQNTKEDIILNSLNMIWRKLITVTTL